MVVVGSAAWPTHICTQLFVHIFKNTIYVKCIIMCKITIVLVICYVLRCDSMQLCNSVTL